jgi:hypothetical protein
VNRVDRVWKEMAAWRVCETLVNWSTRFVVNAWSNLNAVAWLAEMLTIREQQWRVLAAHAENSFVSKVVEHLERALPETCSEMGAEAVRVSVIKGIERARSYRIQTEYDIVRFIDFQYVLGFSFDKDNDWAQEILSNLRIPAQMRLEMIDDYLDSSEADHVEAGGE